MTIRVYVQVDEQRRADACRCLSAVRQIEGNGRMASEAWVLVSRSSSSPRTRCSCRRWSTRRCPYLYRASKPQRCGGGDLTRIVHNGIPALDDHHQFTGVGP
jgi:hypothetical protein